MAEALCPSKRKDLLVEAKELKRGKYNLNCNAIATQFHEVWVGEETLKNKLIKIHLDFLKVWFWFFMTETNLSENLWI